MIRKFALVGVIAAAALSGCATYGSQYGYGGQQGRGDYYYGRPQVSSSVGVSIGTGYGYPYGNGYYGGYGGYPGYGAYGYPSYYGSGYGYGYPSYGYGYPYGSYRPVTRPHPSRPTRPGNGQNVDRGHQQRPGWRDIEGIKKRNEPRPSGQFIQQSQRSMPRVRDESRSSNRGSFSGAVERARRESSQVRQVEP